MGQSGKKEWKPKYSDKPETSVFKTEYGDHHMLHLPLNQNEDTGFGKMKGYGLAQLRAIAKHIMVIREHIEQYPDEGTKQIAVDEHVGKEWKSND